MDFLKAVEIPTCEIQLADEVITVARCPLLPHYHLRIVADRLADSDPFTRLEAAFEYISIAMGVEALSRVDVAELASTLEALYELNTVSNLLPWQITTRLGEVDSKSETAADYEHRDLAIAVDILATAYGWSADEILNLQPEVAACYIQEVNLRDWQDREFSYRLSEVAYGKDGKLIEFPRPDWYWERVGPTLEEATGPMPIKFMPKGVVIGPDGEPVNGTQAED